MDSSSLTLGSFKRELDREVDMHSEGSDEHPQIRVEYSDVRSDKEPELEPIELDLFAATSKILVHHGQFTCSPLVSPSPSVMSVSSNDGDERDLLGVKVYSPWRHNRYSRSVESFASGGSICPSLLMSPDEDSSELGEPEDVKMSQSEGSPWPATSPCVAIEDHSSGPSPIPVGFPPQMQSLSVTQHIKQQCSSPPSDDNDLTTKDMAGLLEAAGEIPASGERDASIRERFIWCLSAANRKFVPRVQKKGACADASSSRRKAGANWSCAVMGCGQDFTRKFGLINHYRAHLSIKHLMCSKCGGTFRTSLRRHEKTCDGTSPAF